MTKTDTSEAGLERLICTALTGAPCDPPKPGQAGKVAGRAGRSQFEAEPAAAQMALFPQPATPRQLKTRARRKTTRVHVGDDDLASRHDATTLDRVHAAMLLQASGRANALRAEVKAWRPNLEYYPSVDLRYLTQ